ncbi:PE-PGRS family protein, partial [Mycobacterium tuberculosis EAS054]
MSFVIAAPDLVAMATEDLAGIGASLTAANAAAAVPTSGLLAAAGDEVSAAIAALFSSHGQQYQAMSAQAAAFHARFVQALVETINAYAAAEAANASPLQTLGQGLLGAINAPAAALSAEFLSATAPTAPRGPGSPVGPGGWFVGQRRPTADRGAPGARPGGAAGCPPGCWAHGRDRGGPEAPAHSYG